MIETFLTNGQLGVAVALLVASTGGAWAFWRRSKSAAYKAGKRREASQHKLDTIITSLAEGRDELKGVESEVRETKAITQRNAVSISRVEGKMEAHLQSHVGDD